MAYDVTAAELLDELNKMQRRALAAEEEVERLRAARPQPTLDRGAVLDSIARAMLAGDGEYAGDWENSQNRAAYRNVAGPYADAVMKLVRPLPTREQIAEAIAGGAKDWLSGHQAGIAADRVLALFTGGKE